MHLLATHPSLTRRVLGIGPVPAGEWLFLAATATTILPAVELHEWLRRPARSAGRVTESAA